MTKKKAARKTPIKGPKKREVGKVKKKSSTASKGSKDSYVGEGLDKIADEVPGFVTDKAIVLTRREIEILQNMANGLSSKQIAEKLSISFDTVESHRKSIHKKIEVNTATEAIAYGFRNEIIK